MTDIHAEDHPKSHPYHMVKPSPWPALGAFSALVLAAGFLILMKADQWWLFIIGVVLVLATMFLWWRDVISEGTFEGAHTKIVQRGLRYGMALFIASEVMFFAAFFWAYFNASIFPTEVIGGVWPPEGVETFNPWDIPLINTIILLTSGVTCTWAHHEIKHGRNQRAAWALVLTVVLGLCFTALQVFEYAHAHFGFREGIYPSTFFMATGFHGFHVIVGTCFLIVCMVRAFKGHFKADQHVGFEAAAWYWHFVDVVWLFLFGWVYWWNGG
jgi:cytochrome c oxidase subunit III